MEMHLCVGIMLCTFLRIDDSGSHGMAERISRGVTEVCIW